MSIQCGGIGCCYGCSDCMTPEQILACELPAPTIIPAESVAAMLGLSVRSVYAAARAGQLPARRVGRRFIFCRETIAEWVRCRE